MLELLLFSYSYTSRLIVTYLGSSVHDEMIFSPNITIPCLGIFTGFFFALTMAGIPSGQADTFGIVAQYICKSDIADSISDQTLCAIPPILSIVITISTIIGAVKILINILNRGKGAVIYILGIATGFILFLAATFILI